LAQHPLVSTNWLAERLGRADLVVFDTTKYLPNEPKDGKADFAKSPSGKFCVMLRGLLPVAAA
jgi:3-mercaptopyruvate sulfurtransferase SseA